MDDALRPAPDASYEAQRRRRPLDADEVRLAEQMIGRPLRGTSAAAVRCGWGMPAVLRVGPRLDDGTPFPTTFWLACPIANREVGRLEGSGAMVRSNALLEEDAQVAATYAAAHERYVAFRDELGPPVPGDPSAGGMPNRVKCLHSVYGHHLATRDNPIGARVAAEIEPMSCPAPCVGLTPGGLGGNRIPGGLGGNRIPGGLGGNRIPGGSGGNKVPGGSGGDETGTPRSGRRGRRR